MRTIVFLAVMMSVLSLAAAGRAQERVYRFPFDGDLEIGKTYSFPDGVICRNHRQVGELVRAEMSGTLQKQFQTIASPPSANDATCAAGSFTARVVAKERMRLIFYKGHLVKLTVYAVGQPYLHESLNIGYIPVFVRMPDGPDI